MRNTEFVDTVKEINFQNFAIKYEDELESEWNTINWDSCKEHIFHLQQQIFHAVKEENDYRKARRYEDLLIRSESSILYSIKKVTQYNKGKRTAGVDNVRVLTDAMRMDLLL